MISSETRNEHDFHLPVSEDYHGLWAIEDTKKMQRKRNNCMQSTDVICKTGKNRC
jgi:hypothetical protein